jgi:GNAT superfamily N-acetyltransferase
MIPPFPIDQAVALSTEAGWNQTPGDWERLFALTPHGCFGKTVDGTLAATSVALVYDPTLAWIGMVLTTEQQRGKGFARQLLGQSLDYCDQQGVACVKLDATDLGRPVYAKLGFVDERPVSRWVRQPGLAPPASPLAQEIDFAFDREAFGADRAELLRQLAAHEVYSIPDCGHAFARPGRHAWHFGPCVARDPQTAAALLAAFLSRHGSEASMLDLCGDHPHAAALAAQHGYQPIRQLMRMYRGPHSHASLASGKNIYCLGAFEYG